MKTFRQTSLSHLQDPDCPKCGPKRAKKEAKLAFKKPSGHNTWSRGPILGRKGRNEVGTPMKTSLGHLQTPKMCPNVALREPKRDQNSLLATFGTF